MSHLIILRFSAYRTSPCLTNMLHVNNFRHLNIQFVLNSCPVAYNKPFIYFPVSFVISAAFFRWLQVDKNIHIPIFSYAKGQILIKKNTQFFQIYLLKSEQKSHIMFSIITCCRVKISSCQFTCLAVFLFVSPLHLKQVV